MNDLTYAGQWSDLLEDAAPEARPQLLDCILFITVQHHADFHRRVVADLAKHPWQLLHIARSLPHVSCAKRRAVASGLMDTPNHSLHITSLKFKRAYASEIAHMRETGKCPMHVWALVALWAAKLPSNTQRIEGINNEIISATKMAPSIELPLLSTRIVG